MANNVEWSSAAVLPMQADGDDLPHPGLEGDEIAFWLGSDRANVLYGSPAEIREWAEALLKRIPSAQPYCIPLPGEVFKGDTVIASTYLTDDRAMLMLLRSEPEYYDVIEVTWNAEARRWSYVPPTLHRFENIVPATEHYVQNGGDY